MKKYPVLNGTARRENVLEEWKYRSTYS